MEGLWIVLGLVAGVAAGASLVYIVLRSQLANLSKTVSDSTAEAAAAREARAVAETKAARVEELGATLAEREQAIEALRGEVAIHRESVARLEAERASLQEQREEFEKRVREVFAEISSDALSRNSRQFLDLAKENLAKFNEQAKGDLEKRQQAIDEMVKPVREKLKEFEVGVKELEKELGGQLKSLLESERRLQNETSNLIRALKNPAQRGQWGEMQLEAILKHAGLQEGVNYRRQVSVSSEDGGSRPDIVVLFPNGQQVVIDSKVPLEAYYEAHSASDDETRSAKFREHAKHVRQHAQALSLRSYQDKFDAFEFVVLFLPAESLFSVAVEHDATLLEFGIEKRVVIASPVQLLGLLRSVALGWKQERLAANAKRISDQAKDLYAGISKVGEHFAKLKKNLDGAVGAYNEAVGSMERNVLPKARRFKELQVAGDDLPALETIDRASRDLQAPELKELPSGPDALMESSKGSAVVDVDADGLFEEPAESPASGA